MNLTNVQFGYRQHQPVIDGITAALPPGRLCALIGPNAAGKSTLLKLMLGLERPCGGSIRLGDRDVTTLSVWQRAAQLAYVPQSPATHVAFSVEEVVAMGRFALPADGQAVERAIEACDLSAIRGAALAELSTGQQQRVALARALAQMAGSNRMAAAADSRNLASGQPGRFLLLDEPVSAMDLKHVHATMRLLRQVAANGVGVLAVMHDLNLASAYADDIWLLDQGRLAAAGTWDEALEPQRLSRVYGVPLRIVSRGDDHRPVFSTLAAAAAPPA